MKKIWLGIGGGMILLGLVAVWPVWAADMTVVCSSVGGECTHEPVGALFNETNMAPGQAALRTLAVQNDTGEDCAITLRIRPVEFEEQGVLLADKLFMTISAGGLSFVDDILSHVYLADPYSLGEVADGDTQQYDWTVSFDREANNDYQNTKAEFDFDLDVSCEPVEEDSPTPLSVSVSSQSSDKEDGDKENVEDKALGARSSFGKIKGATSNMLSGAGSILGATTQKLTHFPVTGAGGPLLAGGLIMAGLAFGLTWRKKKGGRRNR